MEKVLPRPYIVLQHLPHAKPLSSHTEPGQPHLSVNRHLNRQPDTLRPASTMPLTAPLLTARSWNQKMTKSTFRARLHANGSDDHRPAAKHPLAARPLSTQTEPPNVHAPPPPPSHPLPAPNSTASTSGARTPRSHSTTSETGTDTWRHTSPTASTRGAPRAGNT